MTTDKTTTERALDALADVATLLGPFGSFHHLAPERTDEILILLLRSGRVVRGHKRVWRIAIAPEDVPAVRAAGGYLSIDEWELAKERAGV